MDLLKFIINDYTKHQYEIFLDALKTNNNFDIENTILMKIFNELVTTKTELEEEIFDELLYRARIIRNFNELEKFEKEDPNNVFSGYDKYGSKEPAINLAQEGRCNKAGVSYLYLAENDITACAEVKPKYTDIISVAMFKINKTLKVINFSDDKKLSSLSEIGNKYNINVCKLITLIMLQFTKATGVFFDYNVTQYVSSYFQKAGFDGIIYRSSQTDDKCYVFFKTHDNYINFESSTIYYADLMKFNFIRYKDNARISNNPKLISEKDIIIARERISKNRVKKLGV